jgi:hypothetical protein
MKTGLPVFESIDVNLRSLKIELAPSQLYCLADAQTVTIAGQNQGMIPHRSTGNFGRCYQFVYLIRSEILTRSAVKVCQFGHNFQNCEWISL